MIKTNGGVSDNQNNTRLSYNFDAVPSLKSTVTEDLPAKQRNSDINENNSKNGAKFLERFKFAINREKEMIHTNTKTQESNNKQKKQSKINEKMEKAMNREKIGNKFEAHEEKVVGESDMNDNIKFEEAIVENESVIECPEGCGRTFAKDALEKHVVACRKIFLTKRKEFETTKKRAINNEQIILAKKGERKEKMAITKGKNFYNAKGTTKGWKKESSNLQDFIKKKKAETIEKGGQGELPDEVIHVKTDNYVKKACEAKETLEAENEGSVIDKAAKKDSESIYSNFKNSENNLLKNQNEVVMKEDKQELVDKHIGKMQKTDQVIENNIDNIVENQKLLEGDKEESSSNHAKKNTQKVKKPQKNLSNNNIASEKKIQSMTSN